MQSSPGLLKIFLVFLKMGATAFGGNVALVAAIRREISEKRNWISDPEILDLMVIGNILPGPLATNVVFACGKILHGVAGAFIALLGVLLPSFVLMCLFSWMYFTIGHNVTFAAVMNGIIPCVAAIIAATAWNLYRKNVKGWLQPAIVAGALAAMLLWKGFFLTLIIVGVAAIAGRIFMYTAASKPVTVRKEKSLSVFILPAVTALIFAGIFFLPEISLAVTKMKTLALTFGSMSVTIFGGGYVFIPVMEKVVVHEMLWLTSREFTEGIALGQITPGPIMISSVFVGWKVAGVKGAAIAAITLFVPPAVIMYVAQHYLQRIKANATVEAVLRGVRPAVIGMIFASVWVVFRSGEIDFFAAGIFAVAFAVAVWKNPEPVLMILISGIAGWLIY